MIKNISRRRLGALILSVSLLACGGGGGGVVAPLVFELLGLTPNASTNLSGGDLVVITGTNLDQVTVTTVRFGGQPATIVSVTATEIQVMTPAQPAAGTVNVDVDTAANGSDTLAGAYEYRSAPASASSITPTVFSPTGREAFTISGTNLGPANGTIVVDFAGIGRVTGNVNGAATQVTGLAPISPGVPPGSAVDVTLDPGGADVAVPQQVTFDWVAPEALSTPFQTAGGAARPVRLAEGVGMFSAPGANGVWGDADDEVVLARVVSGAPVLSSIRRSNNAPVGFLDAASSVLVRLTDTSCAVYSVGADGAPGTGDDLIVFVSGIFTGAAQVTSFFMPNMSGGPLARVDDDTVALTTAGNDGTLQTGDDNLMTFDFNPPGVLIRAIVGPVDITPGTGNLSMPECPDGDAIFVTSVGPDLTPNTGDDTFRRFVISTGGATTPTPAANLLGRSVFLSDTLAANVGPGPNLIFGDADDELVVFRENGNTFQIATHALGGGVALGAVVPFDRLSPTALLVPVLGTLGGDVVRVYTDPFNNTSTTYAGGGVPLLGALTSGDIVLLGPGPDRVAGSPDDQAFVVGEATAPAPLTPLPSWPLAPLLTGDAVRAFAVASGDGFFLNGDETVQIYHAGSSGLTVGASTLPAAIAGFAPLAGTEPLIPIGSSLGLIQSPGPDRVFGTGDEVVVFVRY